MRLDPDRIWILENGSRKYPPGSSTLITKLSDRTAVKFDLLSVIKYLYGTTYILLLSLNLGEVLEAGK